MRFEKRKTFFSDALGLCPRPRDFLRHGKKVSCKGEAGWISCERQVCGWRQLGEKFQKESQQIGSLR